ncbi:hypothetical protein CSC33_1314 [Pseudomonas aeruginosa]|nr:hypothetical protein CSC33_1314 [Pseudomonas aeruginosa]
MPSICTGQAAYSRPCHQIDFAGNWSALAPAAASSCGLCGIA